MTKPLPEPRRRGAATRSRSPTPAAGATPSFQELAQHSSVPCDTFGTLRVALVAQIPVLLETLGCDSAQVLRRAGVPSRLFANIENRIGYQTVGRLLFESVRATGLAHFGILAGEHFAPAVALGDVIELMRNAPTVEAALRALVLHHYLNDSGAVPTLLPQSERRVALAHSIFWHEVPALETFYDAAMAYGMQIMRLLCGRNWRPLRVTLAHSPPPDLAPYRRMFGPRMGFDAKLSAIEFDADLLKKPVIGADPARYALLRDQLQQRLLLDKVTLTEQVRKALRPMILAGTASASNAASLFSMSDRVLRGRLALERTTVRRLLLQARLEMALQLLRSTQLTVSEIGVAVGYADPPSFVRAFRCHFKGATPGQWRAEAAHGAW
jgi:AraC-like DNA-binding protein